jgi:hypothetical protein
MAEPKLKPAPRAAETTTESAPKVTRAYVDPLESNRGGIGGAFETLLRRFKNLIHMLMIIPVYLLGCVTLGIAAAPGFWLYDQLRGWLGEPASWIKYPAIGSFAAMGFFVYGFTLLLVVPFINFCLQTNLKPWRGPYYSLEAIRWFIHNGLTYLPRFTFLDFVTPTPFNLMFYRLMGMKIGRGTAINTTFISDPSMIVMGDKVTIGGSVTLIAHYGQGGYLVLAPTVIGNEVTIGLKATIMGGVTIGEGAKVMPNSVVMPKTVIPAGETWGGVPAVKIS